MNGKRYRYDTVDNSNVFLATTRLPYGTALFLTHTETRLYLDCLSETYGVQNYKSTFAFLIC